jgi:predicted esterase
MSAPPAAVGPPDEAALKTIRDKTDQLARAIADLKKQGVPDAKLVDVEVFHKAAVWIVRHEEWYGKDYAKWTVEDLDRGLDRAALAKKGEFPWLTHVGRETRAYRSAIDGSVQPFAVILPKGYPGEATQRWRLDLILHGRDDTLNEAKFLQKNGPTAPGALDHIELHVMGRGNNAFRWAGERDVFEALHAFRNTEKTLHGRDTVDADRIVLRGFSMGGAGAWHLGLHYPSFWCAVSPGAGFSHSVGVVKDPPPYVEKTLRIYDAVNYAENVFDVPVTAYGGDKDPQLDAAKSIEAKVKPLGLPMTLLIGKDTAHAYQPDSLKEILKLQGEQAAKGRPAYPSKVRFVTCTPRFGECFHVTVLRQEHQYERTLVEVDCDDANFRVKTENLRAVEIRLPATWKKDPTLDIDGKKVTVQVGPGSTGKPALLLEKREDGWASVEPRAWYADADKQLSKSATLAGPIDDAFTGSFLCVRGTGKPWHSATGRYVDAELQRFTKEWSKWFRGELPVKNDVDVTPEDIEKKHLILFGDPSSNALLAKVLPKLPLQWNEKEIALAGKTFAADGHVPVLIYPNPLQPKRYVVLNSGHTFHTPDFEGTNRLLYPRLGDFAVLKPGKEPLTVEVVTAGLFDEQWRAPK